MGEKRDCTRPLIAAVFALSMVLSALGSAPTTADSSLVPEPIHVDRLPYIFDIAVDRDDSSYLLLATSGGLYRASMDGTALRVSSQLNSIWSLALNPSDPSIIYAAGVSDKGQSVGIHITRDRGHTWHQLGNNGSERIYFRTIDVSVADPAIVYGVGNRLWASDDGGRNWKQTETSPFWIIDLAASSLDVRTVYAATHSGVLSSTDGGASWRVPKGVTCRQPVTAIDSGPEGVVYAFSLCAGLLRGDERTGNWVVANAGFGGCIVQHLAVDPWISSRVFAVLGCRKVLVSGDAGLTWRGLGSQQAWKPDCVTNSTGYPEPNDS